MDATAKLNILRFETTAEGNAFRRVQELPRQWAHLPEFPLTWTLMHVLSERSRLHGYNESRVIGADMRMFLTPVAKIWHLVPHWLWLGRPVADVLKVRLHAARTKVGNFLRHQDRAGALNFWKAG